MQECIINLDSFLSGLSATGLVEHPFWASIPAVEAMVKDFKRVASTASGLLRFTFGKQAAFSQVAQEAIPAEVLQSYADNAETDISNWVDDPEILGDVKAWLLEPVRAELRQQFSSGLDSVGPVVEQFQQNLLSAGLSNGVRADLMLKIPQKHPLRKLVESFAEARLRVVAVPMKKHKKSYARIIAPNLFAYRRT